MAGLFAGTPWDRPATCERCGLLEADCRCPPPAAARSTVPPSKQTARVTREKRQKGKLVTVVSGLSADACDLPALLTKLKSSLGTGGTLDGEQVVLQGDLVDRVRSALEKIGYKTR